MFNCTGGCPIVFNCGKKVWKQIPAITKSQKVKKPYERKKCKNLRKPQQPHHLLPSYFSYYSMNTSASSFHIFFLFFVGMIGVNLFNPFSVSLGHQNKNWSCLARAFGSNMPLVVLNHPCKFQEFALTGIDAHFGQNWPRYVVRQLIQQLILTSTLK